VDAFIYCGWQLATAADYAFAVRVISQTAAWQCRVPMSADREKAFFLPLTIPLWGIVEETHLHLNYHINFLFHADDGRIIGAAAYPVRDRFQFGRVGSLLNLHGPVRWFSQHGYKSVNSVHDHAVVPNMMPSNLTVFAYCVFSSMVTVVAGVIYFVFVLKPRLVKQYLKGD